MTVAPDRILRALVAWYVSKVPAWLRVALPIAWAGLIWWLSSRPAVPQPYSAFYSHVWNLGHVVVFGVLSALIFLSTQGFTPRRAVFASLLAALYGVVDEWHQNSVVGRAVDKWDVGSDAVGAVMAASLLLWVNVGNRKAGWVFVLCLPVAAVTVRMASMRN